MLRFGQRLLVVALSAFVMSLAIYGATWSPSYQKCQAEQTEEQATKNNQSANPTFLRIGILTNCEAVFANENGSAITGVATVLLTIVTGLLAWLALDQGNTTKAQLRAYLVPEATLMKFSLDEPIEIAVTFRNGGQTPAHDFECNGSCFIAALPLPDDAKFPDPLDDPEDVRHSKTAVFPGLEHTITFQCIDLISGPLREALKKETPEGAVYVSGEAVYRDIFDKPRKTRFCLFVQTKDTTNLIKFLENNVPIPDVQQARFTSAHIFNTFT